MFVDPMDVSWEQQTGLERLMKDDLIGLIGLIGLVRCEIYLHRPRCPHCLLSSANRVATVLVMELGTVAVPDASGCCMFFAFHVIS